MHVATPAASPAITPAQQLNARFTAIYATHYRRVLALVLHEVRGDDYHLAEDLASATFFRAWLDLHKCRATTDTGVYAWLAQIARRTVGQHYRIARNTREVAVDTGHWAYANRHLVASEGGYCKVITGANPSEDAPGDSDPDMDEALRRVRADRLAVTR